MTIQGKPINVGDVLHMLQILALVATLGTFYQQFQDFKALTAGHSEQLRRIEHYLASKDPLYYQKSDRD